MSDIHDKAQGYLSRCLKALYPNVKPLPDLLGVCTQIDNVLAGQQAEIERMRAALQTARRDALEEAARVVEGMSKVFHPSQVITDRCAAAIRALYDKE